MSWWYPRLNKRGDIASGDGEIWINGRTLRPDTTHIVTGYSPQWLSDFESLVDGDAPGARIVNTVTGALIKSLGFHFSPRVGNVSGISAGAGHWCGWNQTTGLVYDGNIVDPTASLGAVDQTTGALHYLRPYQATLRDVVLNGVVARSQVSAVEIVAGEDCVTWGEYEQVRTLYGWSRETGPMKISPLMATEELFVGIPVRTPTEVWLVTLTQKGLIVYPWGRTEGYILDGIWFFHHALYLNGGIRVVATDENGAFESAFVDLSKPRVDLSTYKPSTGDPDPEPEPTARPLCTITSYPHIVALNKGADCTAVYTGGLATQAIWKSRFVGEALWHSELPQVPPRTSFSYAFDKVGQVDISLRVEGPGGWDETTGIRRITVEGSQSMPTRQEIGFGPNLGTLDLPQMFTESNLWQYGYDRISTYQLYQGHVRKNADETRFCGTNTLQVLTDANLFSKLRDAGILLELQMAGAHADVVDECYANIIEAGGILGAICEDHAFVEVDAPTFAGYVRAVHAKYPKVIIGAYCAWGLGSKIENVVERIFGWDEFGGRPAFLRMDIDPNHQETFTTAVFTQIKSLCDQRGMTFQVVIDSQDGLTDAQYVIKAKAWFDRAKTIGKWDAMMVQSWAITPDEEHRYLPHNLPEEDPSGHTALLRYCLERFP